MAASPGWCAVRRIKGEREEDASGGQGTRPLHPLQGVVKKRSHDFTDLQQSYLRYLKRVGAAQGWLVGCLTEPGIVCFPAASRYRARKKDEISRPGSITRPAKEFRQAIPEPRRYAPFAYDTKSIYSAGRPCAAPIRAFRIWYGYEIHILGRPFLSRVYTRFSHP